MNFTVMGTKSSRSCQVRKKIIISELELPNLMANVTKRKYPLPRGEALAMFMYP